jgi:hypothetical protein
VFILITYYLFFLLQGVRASAVNACDHRNPCLHGGTCLPTDAGPICDCSNVEFEGINCEKGKRESSVRATETEEKKKNRKKCTGRLPYTLSSFTLSLVTLSRSLCPLVTLSPVTLSPVTLSPGHFVPWSLCPRSLCPQSLCALVILSPGHFVPGHFVPGTLSPIFHFFI